MGKKVTLDVDLSSYFVGSWVASSCVAGVILCMPNSLCMYALSIDERGAFLIKAVISPIYPDFSLF